MFENLHEDSILPDCIDDTFDSFFSNSDNFAAFDTLLDEMNSNSTNLSSYNNTTSHSLNDIHESLGPENRKRKKGDSQPRITKCFRQSKIRNSCPETEHTIKTRDNGLAFLGSGQKIVKEQKEIARPTTSSYIEEIMISSIPNTSEVKPNTNINTSTLVTVDKDIEIIDVEAETDASVSTTSTDIEEEVVVVHVEPPSLTESIEFNCFVSTLKVSKKEGDRYNFFTYFIYDFITRWSVLLYEKLNIRNESLTFDCYEMTQLRMLASAAKINTHAEGKHVRYDCSSPLSFSFHPNSRVFHQTPKMVPRFEIIRILDFLGSKDAPSVEKIANADWFQHFRHLNNNSDEKSWSTIWNRSPGKRKTDRKTLLFPSYLDYYILYDLLTLLQLLERYDSNVEFWKIVQFSQFLRELTIIHPVIYSTTKGSFSSTLSDTLQDDLCLVLHQFFLLVVYFFGWDKTDDRIQLKTPDHQRRTNFGEVLDVLILSLSDIVTNTKESQ